MAVRIKRAIGYGMPIYTFFEHLLLPVNKEDYLGDELERLLDGTRHLRYGGDDTACRVIDGGMITGDRPVADLIKQVGDYDDVDHIIMFPTAKVMADWFRFNDDIDYTFRIAEGVDGEPPTGQVKYLKNGIHPFDDDRMDRNGVRVKCGRDDNLHDFYRDPDLVPGVPDALRWWLLNCGVMGLAGVAQLRPMVAEWWG